MCLSDPMRKVPPGTKIMPEIGGHFDAGRSRCKLLHVTNLGYDPDRCWSYLAGEMGTSLSDGVKPLKYFNEGLAEFMTGRGQAGQQSPTVGNGPAAPIVVAKPRTGEPSPAEYRQAFERVKIQGPRWWGP